jgi:hypothetical protein
MTIASTTRVICGTCRHPRPLHSVEGTGCRARGCHSGPDGGPCAGFTPAAEDVPQAPVVPAATFRAPAGLQAAS